jgi:hypothetical protein
MASHPLFCFFLVWKGRLSVMASSGSFFSRVSLGWLVLSALLVTAGGCGSDGYSGPTGTVRGTVTLNGEPVPAGTGVVFVSDEGFSASGQVDAGGAYELSSANSGKRVPAVSYKVMISAPSGGEGTAEETDYEAMMEASASGQASSAAALSAIPAKYGSTATSGLTFTVDAGDNTIAIELVDG